MKIENILKYLAQISNIFKRSPAIAEEVAEKRDLKNKRREKKIKLKNLRTERKIRRIQKKLDKK